MAKNRLRRIARKLDRGLLPFMGPAQIGAGYPEVMPTASKDATCPVCAAPMDVHVILRSENPAQATRLFCPQP